MRARVTFGAGRAWHPGQGRDAFGLGHVARGAVGEVLRDPDVDALFPFEDRGQPVRDVLIPGPLQQLGEFAVKGRGPVGPDQFGQVGPEGPGGVEDDGDLLNVGDTPIVSRPNRADNPPPRRLAASAR
ncbi:hypothetical protein [Nonomuraea sp. NPDC050202]|uniref:hypothetical protein n=1 Tax=Nonomuraea sp. NPDC050202 TaxID=3155035 RepID=UPI0033FEA2A4